MAKLEKTWDRKEIIELHGFYLLPKHQYGNIYISSQMWCKLEGDAEWEWETVGK